MSWIDDEVKRRNEENASRTESFSEEAKRREAASNALSSTWNRLVDAIIADIEKFNSLSERKAGARINGPELAVHWVGKAPLLTITLDREKFAIVYTHLTETPRKLKIVLNDYSDPYLWTEGQGQMSVERASELLLKPVLFP